MPHSLSCLQVKAGSLGIMAVISSSSCRVLLETASCWLLVLALHLHFLIHHPLQHIRCPSIVPETPVILEMQHFHWSEDHSLPLPFMQRTIQRSSSSTSARLKPGILTPDSLTCPSPKILLPVCRVSGSVQVSLTPAGCSSFSYNDVSFWFANVFALLIPHN